MRKSIFQLQEAKIDEISYVTAPANKKKFLFKKSISLDRVSKGRIVCPSCGHEEALVDFVKSASEECPQCGADLIRSDAKILFKGDKIMKLIKLFKSFLGEDEDLVGEKEFKILEKSEKNIDEDVAKAIGDSLESLAEYSDDFPDAQKADIVTLAKIAISEAGKTAEKKEDEEDEEGEKVKKAGAKLSKQTVTVIKSAISKLSGVPDVVKALQGLIPSSAEKADMDALVEKIDSLTKAIGDLGTDDTKTEKEKETEETDLEKQISDLTKTVNKIAKAGGFKKSLTGDEEEEDEDEDEDDAGKTKTKKGHKWAFTIGGMPEK